MPTRKPDVDAAALDALLRKVFGASTPVTWRRTPDGVSTQVYQLRRGAEIFYLRVAEEAGENLETDAELHQRLRDRDVKVARVVHVEPFAAAIGRSVMVTTEVPGVPLAALGGAGGVLASAKSWLRLRSPDPLAVARSVVAEAGADLAVLNQVPVDGFGWVRRHGRRWPMRAEHPTYPPLLVSDLPRPWPGPLASLLPTPALAAIEDMIEHERARPPTQALLAHGDFDVTPIFCTGGRYTGLIDFGEIRGAEPLFDLGHFHLHDQETHPAVLLPALLDGYQRVRTLPPDHEEGIRRSAVLLGLRQLCRWLGPPRHYPLTHPAVTHRVQRISQLVKQR